MVFGLEYRMLRPYCSSPGTMNSVNVVSASAFCVLCPVSCVLSPVSCVLPFPIMIVKAMRGTAYQKDCHWLMTGVFQRMYFSSRNKYGVARRHSA